MLSNHAENHLFIVETPFQLFCALAFFEANKERFSRENVDMAVYAQFKKATEYVEVLREISVFRNVFHVPPYHGKVVREGLTYIGKSLFFKKRSKGQFLDACPFLDGLTYDYLYVAGATRFPLDVKQFFAPHADTVLFEDGTGSRSGAIFKAFSFMDLIEMKDVPFSREEHLKLMAKRFIDKLTKGRFRLNCSELWVFSPGTELQKRFPQLVIREIPKQCMQGGLVEAVMREESDSNKASVIFFAAPLTTGGGVPESQEKIIKLLESKHEWGAKVRRHPRSFDMPLPHGLESGSDDSCWEAIWGLEGLDEHLILMGYGSTAQVTPKILYDEEPYQVFLHKLLPVDSPIKTAAQEVMDELLRRYRNIERIFSPSSLEELTETIDAILSDAAQGRSM